MGTFLTTFYTLFLCFKIGCELRTFNSAHEPISNTLLLFRDTRLSHIGCLSSESPDNCKMTKNYKGRSKSRFFLFRIYLFWGKLLTFKVCWGKGQALLETLHYLLLFYIYLVVCHYYCMGWKRDGSSSCLCVILFVR